MNIERPALYLVGTPIGNLGDFSPRGKEILSLCDFVAAEDTRVCAKLLSAFGISRPTLSYFEHNSKSRGQDIIKRLKSGECCALVTDAGMPAVSDPGEALVSLCAQNGIPVYAVPGPSAAVSALAVSGLPCARFTFEGFLSTNKKNRKAHLESLREEQRTMVFYEAPHKLKATLEDFLKVFGAERRICLARELTKLHEEVIRTTLGAACDLYSQNDPRGEYTLVLEGAQKSPETCVSEEEILSCFRAFLEEGMTKKDALIKTAESTGLSKNQIYNLCMK